MREQNKYPMLLSVARLYYFSGMVVTAIAGIRLGLLVIGMLGGEMATADVMMFFSWLFGGTALIGLSEVVRTVMDIERNTRATAVKMESVRDALNDRG